MASRYKVNDPFWHFLQILFVLLLPTLLLYSHPLLESLTFSIAIILHSFFKPITRSTSIKMQFSVVALLAVFAASASAVPTSVHFNRQGCDAASCATALGPTAASCVSAAVQESVDPVSDAGCLTSGLSALSNPPAACNGCASGIGGAVTSAVESTFKHIF